MAKAAKVDTITEMQRLADEAEAERSSQPKKVAKRSKAARRGAVRNALITPDEAMVGMLDTVFEHSNGRRIMTTAEAELTICGLPMPGLAPRFLFQQDMMPLSRSLMIYGDWGTAKSSLLHELYRWFLIYSGLCVHIDNENKDAPDLRNAILGHDPGFMRRVIREESDSQEEWMTIAQRWIDSYEDKFARVIPPRTGQKKRMDETAGDFKARTSPKVRKEKPGYVYPLLIGLDSITATASDDTIQGIRDRGAPQREFPIEAQILSKFAKTLPKQMRPRPIVLAAVNHCKDALDKQTGFTKESVPGGKAMRYMDTTEIRMELVANLKEIGMGGVRVRMSIPKNSLGPGQGSVTVDFAWKWEKDPTTGLRVQKARWEWEAATINMLFARKTQASATGGAEVWKDINEVVDLHESDKSHHGQKLVWSKDLGVSSDSPVARAELGRMLEADAARIMALQDILHIRPRTQFVPGHPYEDLKAHLNAQVEAGVTRYAAIAERDKTSFADVAAALDAKAAKSEARRQARRREEDE